MSPTHKIQRLRSANLRQHTHRVTLLPERRTSGSGQLERGNASTPRPGPTRATRVRDNPITTTGPTADLGSALCATAVTAAIVGGMGGALALGAGARQQI